MSQQIIVNSTTHALIRAQSAAGDTETINMSDIGGTNGTSVVAIEYIEYSLIPDRKLEIKFTSNVVYELYGQGKFGAPERRISRDMAPGSESSVVIDFETTHGKGSCLILLRKVSGF